MAAQRDLADIIHAQKVALNSHRLGNFIHRKWNSKGSGTEGSGSVGTREGRGSGKQLPLGVIKSLELERCADCEIHASAKHAVLCSFHGSNGILQNV